MARNDLEDRLIRYAILVITIAESLPKTAVGLQLSGQMIRSSTSAALNYGEAQCAESPKDFIHKIKVILKELRETNVNLRITDGLGIAPDKPKVKQALQETGELIAIFLKSVDTARRNVALVKSPK
jgi:four helix bundle protein